MLEKMPTGRVLIFTRTKRRARNLAADLGQRNYRVAALQGNMAQNQRQQAIDGFRGNKFDILVATDIAARGIDVADISHVINYDMPDTVDAYTHRIGRTGRAQATGEAFTLMQPADELAVRAIEKVLGESIERRRLDGFDYGSFNPDSVRPPVPATQHSRSAFGNRHHRDGRSGASGRPSYRAPVRRMGGPSPARASGR
jgi:ATP-dependent RNA helicase RhlE